MYTVIKEEYIEDVQSKCTLLRHKCGAKIVFLENDDENRVFSIAFRTPPCDNTGKPHIIEHSTLCGSRKYRVKDPFNELDKGTMNTYLNAITYSDKTIYPIGTINEKEYKIMTDIYLDAVFFPLMHENEGIFRQEGWHFGENGINGIVFNEMVGAFSDPEEYLDFKIDEMLYEDNFYKYDSAGVPKAITELEYEDFLAYHKKYYHPANSLIYFYGKLDKNEYLDYLDREYLSKFDEGEAFCGYPDTVIERDKFIEVEKKDADDIIYAKFTANRADDFVTGKALNILCDALINSPAGVLRAKLLELAEDVSAYVEEDLYRGNIVITASKLKNHDMPAKEFADTVRKLADEISIDESEIISEIESLKFYYNECDFGYKPKGLYYGTEIFSSFLYGFEDFESLKVSDIIKKLYDVDYKALMNKYICTANTCCGKLKGSDKDSGHYMPEKKDFQRNDESLKDYHSQSFNMTVPTIELSDIKKKSTELIVREYGGFVFTPVKSDIVYVDMLFDIADLPKELTAYVGIYKNVLGKLDTKKYGCRKLNTELNLNTGGFSRFYSAYNTAQNESILAFNFGTKFLYEKADNALDVINEIIMNTDFSDLSRIEMLLKEQKHKMKEGFYFSGNTAAIGRCMSLMEYSSYFFDKSNGIDYYLSIDKLDNICERLEKIKEYILQRGIKIGLSCKEEYRSSISDKIKNMGISFGKNAERVHERPMRDYKSEAIIVPDTEINNNAAIGKISREYRFDGRLNILCNILNSSYMWDKIRIEGGAYGGSFAKMSDFLVCSSYRDPNIESSYKSYYDIAEYVSDIKLSDEDIKRFIIGTVGAFDTPKPDRTKVYSALKRYFENITDDDIQKMRDDMLSCSVDGLRRFGSVLEKAFSDGCRCSLGTKALEKSGLFERKTIIR